MRRPLRRRLTVRLAIALGLAAGAILVAIGWWNLRLQHVHLTRLLITAAGERADDLRRATREAMLRNDPSDVRKIIETVADQPSIERIRVYDKTGQIRTSSDPREIGTRVDTEAEQCVVCHQQTGTLDAVEGEETSRIFTRPDGHRVLAVVAPIRNELTCSAATCHAHPASQRLLGVLDLQFSLAGVDRDLAISERQMILSLLASALTVLGIGWYLTWRMVLRPVGRLTTAASQVAVGGLPTHVPTASRDEIGDLTETWNTMVDRLKSAQGALESWSRTLEQKVDEKTRELEQAHQQMLQVEKMASLGKLAAVVAHEINNPLTGIGTYARLLRRRLSQDDDDARSAAPVTATEDVLKLIEVESARCGEIVRNLLLFSRMPGPTRTDTALEPLLERCILLLGPQADRAEVRLSSEIEADFPEISCDPAQIQQMILALVLNAIESTPPGGDVLVSAATAESAGAVVLTVRDTGSGIPPERIQRIFEPFFTTKQEGSGVGLGLAVVYGIVHRHHGTIEVRSAAGEGAEFSITLPIAQPSDGGADDNAEEP